VLKRQSIQIRRVLQQQAAGRRAKDQPTFDASLPIEKRCCVCRLMEIDDEWVEARPQNPQQVSDGLCPDCLEERYPEIERQQHQAPDEFDMLNPGPGAA